MKLKNHVDRLFARKREANLRELATKSLAVAVEMLRGSLLLRGIDRVGFGARLIGGSPIIENQGRIEIGDTLRLTSSWIPATLATGPGGLLRVGDDVIINYGTLVSANARVSIGHRVMIGNLCVVSDSETPGEKGPSDALPIEIEDDVWLASRVTVLPGVRIGKGSVITAGSLVSGSIPPAVVAGGIPARVLRRLDGGPAETAVRSPVPAERPSPATSVALSRPEFRGVLVADFTVEEVARALRHEPGAPELDAEVAPFGQVTQYLLAGVQTGLSDFAVLWTRPESAVPSFGRLRDHGDVDRAQLVTEVDAYCTLVEKAATGYRFVFVPTWTAPPWQRGLGLIDGRERGTSFALAFMNLRLMERLSSVGNVYVLNAQRWVDAAGTGAHSSRLWYLGKAPFHPRVMAEAARDVKAAICALSGGSRKLLVLDLDDTLWGGIVGDVGWENLRLGGHDPVGEAFVDFQRAVKALTRRGIVLGIVSKNEEATALTAIGRHPEMVLREEDFVGWRINWRDKAQNLSDLAAELKLGLQSVVFIDDNPVERARVREALPEVLVPEWPEDKLLYPSELRALRCFDAPSVSKEDIERTRLYAAERQRERLHGELQSVDEWLKSLNMRVRFAPIGVSNVTRAAQLFNKTNQMNLSTRRMTEQELMAWARKPGRTMWAVSISDRFGDAGLTGIVSLDADHGTGQIVDFLLSCRVMGRKVEDAMVHVVAEHARKLGLHSLEARLTPSAKNKPCLDFWRCTGFRADGEHRFIWDLTRPYPCPEALAVEQAE